MNKQQFIQYLNEPHLLTPEATKELKEVMKAYPGFQTGHLLLLKSLYQSEDIMYDKYLSKAAAYAGNRELLFNFIFSNEPEAVLQQEAVVAPVKHIEPKIVAEKKQKPSYFDTVTISNDYFNVTESEIQESINGIDGVHSFSHWLELMSRQKPEEPDVEPQKEKSKGWDLIDNFIKGARPVQQDKSKANDPAPKEDLSQNSVNDNEEFMTETLARIYIRQKNYSKALQIFEKLSLKYPEKSIYFAGQIKIVEDLKNNEK